MARAAKTGWPRLGPPGVWRRTAIISAATEIAISSGDSAPISSPIGANTRANAPRGPDAFLFQFLHHRNRLALAADHGDVARRRIHGPAQHAHIVAMAARHDDHVAGFVDRQLGKTLRIPRRRLRGFGKALAVGEGLAVIDDGGGENPARSSHLRKALRNVAAAENERARLRQNRLHEDIQLAAADQAVVVGRVLAQAEDRWRGLPVSMTSRAAFQTSASTQPPPMVPIMEPSSRTSSLALS
jgi:hypothetical protein